MSRFHSQEQKIIGRSRWRFSSGRNEICLCAEFAIFSLAVAAVAVATEMAHPSPPVLVVIFCLFCCAQGLSSSSAAAGSHGYST